MCVYYMTGAPEGSPKVVLWRSRDQDMIESIQAQFCKVQGLSRQIKDTFTNFNNYIKKKMIYTLYLGQHKQHQKRARQFMTVQ